MLKTAVAKTAIYVQDSTFKTFQIVISLVKSVNYKSFNSNIDRIMCVGLVLRLLIISLCDNFVKERFRGLLFYCAVYNAEADEEVWA